MCQREKIKKYVGKYSSASAIKTIDSALARNVKQSNSKRFKVIGNRPRKFVPLEIKKVDTTLPLDRYQENNSLETKAHKVFSQLDTSNQLLVYKMMKKLYLSQL